MFEDKTPYTVLLSDAECNDQEEERGQLATVKEAYTSGTTGPPENRLRRFLLWACLLSVLCSVINGSVTVFTAVALRSVAPSQLTTLEYASTYMGFDSIYRNPAASPPPPVDNFPVAVGIFNRSPLPYTSMLLTGHPRSGLSIPESVASKFLQWSETTLAQFWAGDYGMERCSLEFTLPPSSSGDDLLGAEEPTSVEVWHVDAQSKLNVQELSWQSRPPRVGLAASWNVYPNRTARSPEFHCRSRSFQTFELACVGDGCLLEFLQSPKRRDIGLWLVQRTSA
ncbi:hypothetical protein BV20DRAFT_1051503 [Pilatotrama ljubarskyi]|nr:hypothetical protein BV20DRAFT_1051503 [Pilatotrama ljubarskyi]